VDAMRRVVFAYLPGKGAGSPLAAHLTWGSWVVPAWLEVTIVAGTGVALLGAACVMFDRKE
jgi:hypothetical protein